MPRSRQCIQVFSWQQLSRAGFGLFRIFVKTYRPVVSYRNFGDWTTKKFYLFETDISNKARIVSQAKSTQLKMINLTPSALPDLPLTSLRTAEEKRADNVFMGKSTVIGKK